jgi:modulator of FtsH protease HflC
VRRAVIFAITFVFAIALLARASTYTVRFTENAVLTTFGSASDTSVKTEPGLKFKWPDPIQSVTKYDNRTRFLQTPPVTQQTLDNRQLVLESFCTWNVSDPLRFFQKFSNAGDRAASHYQQAEGIIRGNLRSAMGEISRYRIDELFTPSSRASKLPDLEQKILETLLAKQEDGSSLADYGVTITAVGVNRIILPEETTGAVMDSMRQDRSRLVQELESKGQAQRQAIITAAQAHAEKIRAFAEAYAAEIRRQGDLEAEQYIAQMNESPELAVFLKNIEFMRTAMAKRITYVVNGGIPGFELFFPDAQRTGRSGIPGISGLMGHDPVDAHAREQMEFEESQRIATQRRPVSAPSTTTPVTPAGDRQ